MSDIEEVSADEYNALVGKRKASKYRNVKTVIDDIPFDSKAEARRYSELKLMLDAGEILHLLLQPKYPIAVNGVKICTYIADFQYRYFGSPVEIVEDVKGVRTPAYQMKKKLMKAVYGIEIQEV